MSNEEQIADTIEMLYKRLNEYHKQDLFNYGYLLESNQILCKDIEEKDKEIERYKNVIDKIKEYIEKHIACMKNGNVLAEFNIDELCELLEEVE